eukprot:6195053-Amphidinium_carterae.2
MIRKDGMETWLAYPKYCPQTLGNSIYVGRTYSVIRDFHEYGSVQSEATYYHKFPIGQIQVIQQLMVTKMNVCPHPRAGCVVASIHHLGIYGLMIPVENLGVAAASTHDVNWVDSIKFQDVIGMCSMRDAMN